MTAVKQAFANLRADIRDSVLWWAGRGVDVDTIEAALRESQKRVRDMFNVFRRNCHCYCGLFGKQCAHHQSKSGKCLLSICPRLARKGNKL